MIQKYPFQMCVGGHIQNQRFFYGVCLQYLLFLGRLFFSEIRKLDGMLSHPLYYHMEHILSSHILILQSNGLLLCWLLLFFIGYIFDIFNDKWNTKLPEEK